MSVLSMVADARRLPISDGSVNLIVTSPPYNARVSYDAYSDWLPWADYWHGLIEPAMRECYRVLAHGGRLAVNLANVVRPFSNDVKIIRDGRNPDGTPRPLRHRDMSGDWPLMVAPRLWALLEDIGFLPREQITWVKAAHEDDVTTASRAWGTYRSARNPVVRAVAEPIFVASKGTHSREDGPSDLTSDEYKAWTRNVWFVPARLDALAKHPAQFPVEIPRRIIKLYSYVGDVVLDPFSGSGTTIRAAREVGRHGVGLDISAGYSRRAGGRSSQGTLWEAVS